MAPSLASTRNPEPDALASRLTQLLQRLNEGKSLNPQALADEFGITLRTVQRDINQRFAFLPLQKTQGRYHLDPIYLGKITTKDIARFAALAGVSGLFPSLSNEFLREVFDTRMETALLVQAPSFEDLGSRQLEFEQLQAAITSRHTISFAYQKPEGLKRYANAQPYKLVNNNSVWYLAARDGETLKAFSFTKIGQLQVHDTAFTPDPAVHATLANEDSIWLNPQKIEVVLKIAPQVASYFRRRKLLSNQVIEKDLEDGGLLISCKAAHPNQILPTVRYWLPHVRIISPEGLQEELEAGLRGYLGQKSTA